MSGQTISKEKKIEEMADFLWKNTLIHTEDLCHDVSETCYNAGYRKQSQVDWHRVAELNAQRIIELEAELVKAKQEVAREIFEEIYEDCFDQFGYIDYNALAELKKKYTEGENG